jgi:hypothetical protein
MKDIHAIADAVAVELDGIATLSEEPAIERAFRPENERAQLGVLTLSVVPASVARTYEARGVLRFDYNIEIGVQRALDEGDEESQVSKFATDARKIADFLDGLRPAAAPEVVCVEVEIDPVADRDHLSTLRTFTSVVKARFRGFNT